MIQRAPDLLTIEGPIVAAALDGVSGPGPGGDFPAPREALAPPPESATLRRRISIDPAAGTIVAVEVPGGGTADLELDDGHVIFPGFLDAHVHAREDVTGRDNYKEDFESAGRAALRGGITAYAEMPNNPEPPLDDDSYRKKRELTEKSAAEVLLFAIVGRGTSPLSFKVPYKVYMAQSIGDFFFRSEEELRDVLPRYRGERVAFHAELPEILKRCESAPTHGEQRPPEAEVEAIELALRLCDGFGVEAHICHLSTAAGLEVIRAARARGQRVTTEVTPHHLFWDEENARQFSPPHFLQCNPPLRREEDRRALLEGLARGDIDFLATDHAPHSVAEKEAGMSGVTHLDTVANFACWLLDQGFEFADLHRVLCEAPGRFFGRYLSGRYGRIAPGYVASLTVLDRRPRRIRRSELATRAGWSCFEGQVFSGGATHTVVRGTIHELSAAP